MLRALIIKQANGFSDEQLAFHLADSQTYRAFCLLGYVEDPHVRAGIEGIISFLERGFGRDRCPWRSTRNRDLGSGLAR